ncbi:MAG TPA: hypothetical protein VL728_15215 [Cyclobacteriaceae bacterium]|jgi:YD repeat-containing protein|nr:hypothetical protein [Cyclobacteriaceae bacterium]
MNKIAAPIVFMAFLYAGDMYAQACNLTRIIEADGDTISLSYDATNHVSSLGKNSVVKTNSNGHFLEVVHEEAKTNSLSRATYKYDNNNNLLEYEQFMGASTTPAFIMKFTYNSFHQVIEAQSAVAVKTNFFYGYRVFTYANTTTKNPTTIKNYSGDAHGKTGSADETITLTYDDKKTTGYINPLDDFSPFATHNVVSATVSAVGSKPVTETFTYQYNAQGYPVSRTEREGGRSFTTNFSYSCRQEP